MQKIAFIGAESSGKTTLAKFVAERLHAPFVPEFVRNWVDAQHRLPNYTDVNAIVEGQISIEMQLATQKSPYLVCDTTPLVNYVLIKHYFGKAPLWIEQEARYRKYDYLFLMLPDFPWMPDGLQRENPAVQQKIHQDFLQTLMDFGIPHIVLGGHLEERFKKVMQTIGREDF